MAPFGDVPLLYLDRHSSCALHTACIRPEHDQYIAIIREHLPNFYTYEGGGDIFAPDHLVRKRLNPQEPPIGELLVRILPLLKAEYGTLMDLLFAKLPCGHMGTEHMREIMYIDQWIREHATEK